MTSFLDLVRVERQRQSDALLNAFRQEPTDRPKVWHVPPEDHPLPPHNGTVTSREAAEKIVPEAERQRDAVLAALRAAPDGLTREEICEATGLSGDSVRPRVWEAINAGTIQPTTETRQTASGRRAYILKAR